MILWLIGEAMMFGFMYLFFRNNYRKIEIIGNVIAWIKSKKFGMTDNQAVMILTVAVWIFVSIIVSLCSFLLALTNQMFKLLIELASLN